MSVFKTHNKHGRLLAALVACLWTLESSGAEWTNYSGCGANCTPNVQTYGYIPTQWRRWPGTDVQVSAVGDRPQAFPAPRYELPRPLHEAEGSPPPGGPMMTAPMGSMEPGTGLPDSTRPMEGGSKKPMSPGEERNPSPGTSPFNPFKVPSNPSKSGDMPPPDSSRQQIAPLPDLARSNVSSRVTPVSAVLAEPLSTADASVLKKGGNPLRDEPVAGLRPIKRPSSSYRAGEVAGEPSRDLPRTNPLRDN